MGGSWFCINEAAMNNLFIISSNCKNGPTEFLKMVKEGFYLKVTIDALYLNFKIFNYIDHIKSIYLKSKVAKKNCKKYSLLNHYISFNF